MVLYIRFLLCDGQGPPEVKLRISEVEAAFQKTFHVCASLLPVLHKEYEQREIDMRKSILIPLVVLIGFSTVLSGCSHLDPATRTTYIHFFVAPKFMPDKTASSKEMASLRTWLASRAGGYTELMEAPGGWLNAQSELETEDQVGFFLSATSNLKKAIEQYLITNFKETQPYVEVWTALD